MQMVSQTYVGILLNRGWYQGIRTGKTGHEAMLQYVASARSYGLTPCFIQLRDIKPGAAKVSAYLYSDWKVMKKEIPMPRVIHNRAIYKNKAMKDKIKRISQSGTIVFNQNNRYGKLYIHKLLLSNPDLRVHLPETEEATMSNLKSMMAKHASLILKPNNGSIGKGIMLMERREDGDWQLRLRLGTALRTMKQWHDGDALPLPLLNRIQQQRYLVQQRLPLATLEGRPFDIRVSVQRDKSGKWQITGMVGKAAAARSFLTNVAQGGEVYTLERILKTYPTLKCETVRGDIARFSLLVAEELSLHLPELADIGLDIGITEFGFPMFIECNGRDLRYSFLRGGLLKEWTNTYRNPMGYAAYLIKRGLPHSSS
jgi:hypothetical protein